VLLSWQNIDIEISRGRAPAAELFDHGLAQRLEAETSVLERQLVLLDFFYERFAMFLSGRVVRYEDIVASNGRELSILSPAASCLDASLQSRNRHFILTDGSADALAARLTGSEHSCWRFYSRSEVEALLD
jgi:hypothetical protein